MFPYFHLTTIPIGPVNIQVWGLLVALGIFIGAWVSARNIKEQNLDHKILWDMVVWIILGSFIFGRLFHAIYEPGFYTQHPFDIIKIWKGGMSIMGGFFGAVLGSVWFLRKSKVDTFKYLSSAVYGLPVGLFIGRLGCYLINDHPGSFTSSFLGVPYPDGVRFDHGLLLSLNGLVLAIIFLVLKKIKVQQFVYPVVFLIWYGVVRFLLDFIRATDGNIVDTRYFNLTPAQYFSLAMIAVGLWILKKNYKTK